MIQIEIQQIENGWVLSVFNDEAGTKDLPNIFCKTLDEALKETSKRADIITEEKE